MSAADRLLDLLALLQSRRVWAASELADRLEVSTRTLRRDVARLQELGYPVRSSRGTGGGYALAPEAAPAGLALSQDEAASVVLGLVDLLSGLSPQDERLPRSALDKVVEGFGPKVRRRVGALAAVVHLTEQDEAAHQPDLAILTSLAVALRDSQGVRLTYTDHRGRQTQREVEPHGVVSVDRLRYPVAYDLSRQDWRLLRIDRVGSLQPSGRVFARRQVPGGSIEEFVRERRAGPGAVQRVRATASLPAARARRLLGGYATVVPLDASSCEIVLLTDRLEWAAFALGVLEVEFTLHEPAQARTYLESWGRRFLAAVSVAPGEDEGAEDAPAGCDTAP